MSTYAKFIKQRFAVVSAMALCLALSVASVASAAQDYSAIETDITAEVTAALPVVLGVAALAIAVPFALKLIRRVAR